MLSSMKVASNCKPAARTMVNEIPKMILTSTRKVNPNPTAIGRNERFFPSRMCLRGTGSNTSWRNPPRSKPNWLSMRWLIPRRVNTMGPLATNNFKLSLRLDIRRAKNIVPKSSSMMKLVASAIFTSGARVRQRKKASASAAASSGIPGSCLSRKFFLTVETFLVFGLCFDLLPTVCPW